MRVGTYLSLLAHLSRHFSEGLGLLGACLIFAAIEGDDEDGGGDVWRVLGEAAMIYMVRRL